MRSSTLTSTDLSGASAAAHLGVSEPEEAAEGRGRSRRRKFNQYQRYGALAFAVVQAVGQCLYVRPYVEDFSLPWLLESSAVLTAGAMILLYIGEVLTELKLGNGTPLLIFTNIISSLPSSFGQTLSQANEKGDSATVLPVFFGAFFLSALGIVYVQEAERKIPMNYSTRFPGGRPGKEQLSALQGELRGCDAHHLRVVAVGASRDAREVRAEPGDHRRGEGGVPGRGGVRPRQRCAHLLLQLLLHLLATRAQGRGGSA